MANTKLSDSDALAVSIANAFFSAACSEDDYAWITRGINLRLTEMGEALKSGDSKRIETAARGYIGAVEERREIVKELLAKIQLLPPIVQKEAIWHFLSPEDRPDADKKEAHA